MSQGMGYVTGRDPLPTLGSRPGGSPPEKRLPTSVWCGSPDQVPEARPGASCPPGTSGDMGSVPLPSRDVIEMSAPNIHIEERRRRSDSLLMTSGGLGLEWRLNFTKSILIDKILHEIKLIKLFCYFSSLSLDH